MLGMQYKVQWTTSVLQAVFILWNEQTSLSYFSQATWSLQLVMGEFTMHDVTVANYVVVFLTDVGPTLERLADDRKSALVRVVSPRVLYSMKFFMPWEESMSKVGQTGMTLYLLMSTMLKKVINV